MSLLRGLAERALGTAQPVRSQHARPMRGLHREAALAAAFAPDATDATTPQLAAEAAPAGHAQPVARPTAREAPMPIEVDAPIVPLVVKRGTEFDPAPPMQAATQAAPRAEAAPQGQGLVARQAGSRPAADPSMPDPEPLVTRSAAAPPDAPRPRHPGAITPRRAQQAARTAGTAAAPTEVHVSIGRVELTALAPAPSRRAERPRDPVSARGLSDYLRGPRGRS